MLQLLVGTVTGSGAAINISLGFKPAAVFLYTTVPTIGLWMKDQGAAKGMKVINHDTAQVVAVAANGITEYAGGQESYAASHVVVDVNGVALTEGDVSSPGFTIGTESGFNTNAKEIYYVALRAGPDDTAASPDYTDEDP